MSLLALLAANVAPSTPTPTPDPDPLPLVEGYTAHMVGHNNGSTALDGRSIDSEIVLVAETHDPVVTLPYLRSGTWTGRASVVLPDGTAHPLTVNGNRDLTITTPTDADRLDGVTLPTSGATFRVWSTGTVPVPAGWTGRAKRIADGDLTGGGIIAEDRRLRSDPPVPYAIRGKSTYAGPQVLIVGDSITTNYISIYTYSADYGTFWSEPLMKAGIPSIMTGVWAESFSSVNTSTALTTSGHHRFDAILAPGLLTHAMVEFGVNDIYGAGGGVAPWDRARYLWAHLKAAGMDVYHTTTTPYAHPDGLTVSSKTPIRNEWNDALRAGQPELSGHIEITDQVEPSRGAGTWVDGLAYTSEGIHPNDAGIRRMRPAVAAWAASIKA